jgi:hypothetical protein
MAGNAYSLDHDPDYPSKGQKKRALHPRMEVLLQRTGEASTQGGHRANMVGNRLGSSGLAHVGKWGMLSTLSNLLSKEVITGAGMTMLTQPVASVIESVSGWLLWLTTTGGRR